jgi:hypothetical protein
MRNLYAGQISSARSSGLYPLGYASGPNLYAYVDNDPLNRTDPNGQCIPWCVAALAGAASGAGIDLVTQLVENGGQFSNVSWTSVGTSALAGAVVSTFGPTGLLLGRGGARAAQFGYSESAELLNRGTVRFGWSFNQGAREDVLSLRVGSSHVDIPGTGLPAGANPVGNGLAAGAVAGTGVSAFTPTSAAARPEK